VPEISPAFPISIGDPSFLPDRGADKFEKFTDKAKLFMHENKIFLDQNKKQYNIVYDVLENLELPHAGTTFRIRTQQQISLFAIIAKILYEHPSIDNLTIATYTINTKFFDLIMSLFDSGKIKKLSFLIASSYTFRSPENYEYFKKVCLKRHKAGADISLMFAWSHFKITLVKCGDDFYQFEGSMNYSINNMAENLILCNSEEIYNQDYDFIKNIMMDSENKALELVC